MFLVIGLITKKAKGQLKSKAMILSLKPALPSQGKEEKSPFDESHSSAELPKGGGRRIQEDSDDAAAADEGD